MPTDPLTIARRRATEKLAERRPENWGVNRAALCLPANDDVQAWAARSRTGVYRRDVFDRLLAGERPSMLAAVRRLQADVGSRIGSAGGVGRYAERIDVSRVDDLRLDRQLSAGARLGKVLALAGQRSARLLLALVEPETALGRSTDWRKVIEQETGERLAEVQAEVVRAACVDLADAYADLDRAGR